MGFLRSISIILVLTVGRGRGAGRGGAELEGEGGWGHLWTLVDICGLWTCGGLLFVFICFYLPPYTLMACLQLGCGGGGGGGGGGCVM